MAIAKIKKIEIIGLEKDKERLMVLLQRLGIVELISPLEVSESPIEAPKTVANLLEMEEAISYLTSFQEKAGLLEGMVKLRPLVYKNQLNEVIASFDYQGALKELQALRNRLKVITQHKEQLIKDWHLLSAWSNLKIPLDKLHYTETCGIFLGLLRTTDYENLLENIKIENINLFCEPVSQDTTNTYLVILYLKKEFEKIESLLKNHHFNFITLKAHKGTVEEKLLELNREILVLDDQMQEAKTKILELAKERFRLMVAYDYLYNIKQRFDAGQRLYSLQYTFSLSGWIRQKDIKVLEKEIFVEFKDMAIFVSEPKEGEDIPICLENKPLMQPFEAVTNLYGQPAYNGLDPSGYLAPFFAFSFGFCLMDAGYGIALLSIMLFFLKKKQISIQGRKLLKLFVYCSMAAILAGIITGGFFGDLISRLPEGLSFIKNIQRRLTLFNPVKDALLFLGLILLFGFFQVLTGVFIKFLRSLRRDKFTAFFLDLPTLLIQTGLLILLLIWGKVLPYPLIKYAFIILVLSIALVVFYQWKSNPEISLKIFWSIFGVYAIITGNFLADTLSFSRIFALGLTGSLLGMAINTMLFPKRPPAGIMAISASLMAILVLLLAHIMNLAISILGAYVHTSRLQYLEFFTKFFESGGRPFRPFKEETKYIFLTEGG